MKQLIFALVIALLAGVFAIQNAGIVTVNLFFWELSMSLALLILCILILGIITGMLLMSKTILNKNSQIRNLQKQAGRPTSV